MKTYAKPDKTFIKVVFPAPEGPMIAVSSPGRKSPDTLDNIFFLSVKNKRKENKLCGHVIKKKEEKSHSLSSQI